MGEEDFTKAVFQPTHRSLLLNAMHGDSILADRARAKIAQLQRMQEVGQVFDRDHISKNMFDMLKRMIAQVDASKQQDPDVVVK